MAKSPEVGSGGSEGIYRLIFGLAATDVMVISTVPLREALRTVTMSNYSETFYIGMSAIVACAFGLVAGGIFTEALASRNRN